MQEENVKTYTLPIEVYFTFPLKKILLFIGSGLFSISIPIFIYYFKKEINLLFIGLFILGLILIFLPIMQNVFRNNKVIISKNKINIINIFKSKEIYWKDIEETSIFELQGNVLLGLTTKRKIKEKKEGFIALLQQLSGENHDVNLPLNLI